MNIEQIQKRNEKLQNLAIELTEAIPAENLFPYTSIIIRSLKKINNIFPKLITNLPEMSFYTQMEKLEEEVDEVIWGLDKLHDVNRKYEIVHINEAIKFGYELLSIYSMASDKIIEKRVSKEHDEI